MQEGLWVQKIRSITGRVEWAWAFEGGKKKYALTRGNVAWAIASAFLDQGYGWGYMNWERIKRNSSVLAAERLKCLYDYFERVEACCDMNEVVEYEWVSKKDTACMSILDQSFGLNVNVNVHTGRMEEAEGAIVDFANANLHIHSIIPSVTQEELLFSVCSECFLGLALFPKTLGDEDVIVFRNVWNHASYSGYDTGFRFTGPLPDTQRKKTIIAMDACEADQFGCVWRDLFKAYVGFGAVADNTISTGNWGCGAFGGDVHLKFLQQVLAAQWAGKFTLHYSTFGNALQAEEFTRLLAALRAASCEWVYDTIQSYNPISGMRFGLHLKSELMHKELAE